MATLINTAVAGSQSGVSTLDLPATSLTTGNLIAVAVRWAGAPATTCAITDTAGNTYSSTPVVSLSDGVQWFYCLNAIGNASNVVRATFSASASFAYSASLQYSGVLAKDTVATGTNSGLSITSSAFTTTSSNELILAAIEVASIGDTWTAGGGYTIRALASAADRVLMVEDQTVSTIQTGATASASSLNSAARIMSVVTFSLVFFGGASGAKDEEFPPYFYGRKDKRKGTTLNRKGKPTRSTGNYGALRQH